MKSNSLLIAGLAAITALVAYGYSASSRVKTDPAGRMQSVAPSQMEKQTSDEGGVEVTVTPGVLAPEANTWDFEVSLNTHSVELAEDVARVSVLVDEQDKEYRPLSWTGDPPGGHHREGILSFDPINPAPAAIRLEIRGVGGVAARNFAWNLAR